jgi:uncharacterized protein
MTPDEQRLIQDLFDRLGAQSLPPKDRQAETLIMQSLRQNPDSAYLLVQSAIVYERQLADNQQRIEAMEAELDQAGSSGAGTASFLGDRIGGDRIGGDRVGGGRVGAGTSSQRGGSVPRFSGRSADAPSPWAQPGPAGGRANEQQPPIQSGGFLRSALSTVAGVAGGVLVADSLRDLFGGDRAHAATPSSDAAALKDADKTQDELQDQTLDNDDDYGSQDDGGSDSDGGIDI